MGKLRDRIKRVNTFPPDTTIMAALTEARYVMKRGATDLQSQREMRAVAAAVCCLDETTVQAMLRAHASGSEDGAMTVFLDHEDHIDAKIIDVLVEINEFIIGLYLMQVVTSFAKVIPERRLALLKEFGVE